MLITLEYLREYRTYFHIGQNYGISESSAYKGIKWVKDIFVKFPELALPGRKAFLKSDNEIEVILMDVTETPIGIPEKKAYVKKSTSCRQEDRTGMCTAFSNGKRHDLRLFKESSIIVNSKIKIIVDTGYMGKKLHNSSEIPKKRSKTRPLTKEDKRAIKK